MESTVDTEASNVAKAIPPTPIADGPILFVVHHKETMTREEAAEFLEINIDELDTLTPSPFGHVETATVERSTSYRLFDLWDHFKDDGQDPATSQLEQQP
jgi:hypothetical protein